MGNRVKRVRTFVSELDMANAIKQAWIESFNYPPSKEQVAMLMAQNALETGNRKSMWNYNVGNITTGSSGKFNYFDDLTTDEQIKPGKWKKMNLKYRAYDSLKDGVKDYIRLISNGRYTKAWQNVLNPDPVKFSKELKNSGYYTANEAPYTKSLTSLFNQFSKKTQYSNKDSKPLSVNERPFRIEDAFNKVLKMVAQDNNFLIKINSENVNDSIEFARILSLGLKEELKVNATTYNSGNLVESGFKANLPKNETITAIKQYSDVLANVFNEQTKLIESCKLDINVFNKTSTLNIIDIKVADRNHRKFLIRFARKI